MYRFSSQTHFHLLFSKFFIVVFKLTVKQNISEVSDVYFNSSLHWFHAKSFASLSVNWVTSEMFFCMKCSLVWTEALITSTLCHSSCSQLVLLLGFSQLLMEMCIIQQRGFCGEKKKGEKMGKGAGLEGQGGNRGWTIKGRLPEETDSNSDQKL